MSPLERVDTGAAMPELVSACCDQAQPSVLFAAGQCLEGVLVVVGVLLCAQKRDKKAQILVIVSCMRETCTLST